MSDNLRVKILYIVLYMVFSPKKIHTVKITKTPKLSITEPSRDNSKKELADSEDRTQYPRICNPMLYQ